MRVNGKMDDLTMIERDLFTGGAQQVWYVASGLMWLHGAYQGLQEAAKEFTRLERKLKVDGRAGVYDAEYGDWWLGELVQDRGGGKPQPLQGRPYDPR
jgi:hypothetical protein